MHSNTIVKPRRLAQGAEPRGPPDPTPTAHRDPEPHEILATTTNHPPLPPPPRPVPAQRGAARRTHTPPLPHTPHRASSRQGEQKLPPSLLPRLLSRRRLLSSPPLPFSPAPRVLHSPRARSSPDPSPDSSSLRSPRVLPELARRRCALFPPSLRRDSLRLVAGGLGACRRPGAAGRVSFHRRLRWLRGGTRLHLCCPLCCCLAGVEWRSNRAWTGFSVFAGFEVEAVLS